MKKLLLFTLKIITAAALILLLLKLGRLDTTPLKTLRFDVSTVAWLLCGALAVAIGNGFAAVRLKVLLSNSGIIVPLPKVLALSFASTFIGYVLPGLVFGDAFKAVYLYRKSGDNKKKSPLVVFLDRAIGLFSFLLLSSLSLLSGIAFGYVGRELYYLLVVPAAAVAMVVALYVFGFFGHRWFSRAGRSRVRLLNVLRDGYQVIDDYIHCPRLAVITLVYSIINHVLIVFSFVVVGSVVEAPIPVFIHFIFDPICMIANAIPITPGGLGITESVFSLLYQTIGYDNGAFLGLMGRFLQYTAYIVGGIVAVVTLDVRNLLTAQPGENDDALMKSKDDTRNMMRESD